MKEIKRYEVVSVDGVPAHRLSKEGRWVKYEDKDAIVTEKDAHIAALQEQVRALAAEGSAIKQAFKQAANTVEEYEIYGDLKYAVEPSEYEELADAIEETPNTDAALREIMAQAVESFMSWSDSHIEEGDEYEKQLREVSSACKVFAARIRAGEQP